MPKKILKESLYQDIFNTFQQSGVSDQWIEVFEKLLTGLLYFLTFIILPVATTKFVYDMSLLILQEADLSTNKKKLNFAKFLLFNYNFYKKNKNIQLINEVKDELINIIDDEKLKENIKNAIILFDNLGYYSWMEEMKGQYINVSKIIVMSTKSFKNYESLKNTLYHELIHYFDLHNTDGVNLDNNFGVLSSTLNAYFSIIIHREQEIKRRWINLISEFREKHGFANHNHLKEGKLLRNLADSNFNDFVKYKDYFLRAVELTARFLSIKRDLKKKFGDGKFIKDKLTSLIIDNKNVSNLDYFLILSFLVVELDDNDWRVVDIMLYNIYEKKLKINK